MARRRGMQEATWGGCAAVACRQAVPELPKRPPAQGMRVPGRALAGRGNQTMALLKGTSPSGVAKASASRGAGWDPRFLQSALTYKQPPHVGSGLQPCSKPKIKCEATKHPSSTARPRCVATTAGKLTPHCGSGASTSCGFPTPGPCWGGTHTRHIPGNVL